MFAHKTSSRFDILVPFCVLVMAVAGGACSGTDGSAPKSVPKADQGAQIDGETITKEEAKRREQSDKADDIPGVDVCKRGGWYGDGECDTWCDNFDAQDCSRVFEQEPSGEPADYPIVLAHGFAAGPDLIPIKNVAEALREDGHTVVVGEVPPFRSVKTRAEKLALQVDSTLQLAGAQQVHIIAHSMGGLDARYLISSLEDGAYADRVRSLTTISTPHRGTRSADIGLKLIDGPRALVLNVLVKLASDRLDIDQVSDHPWFRRALHDLAIDQNPDKATFVREENPMMEGVHYQSYAGVTEQNSGLDEVCEGKWYGGTGAADEVDPVLKATAQVVGAPSDGLVSVKSAKYGEFRGCFPADHADEVGQFDDQGTIPRTGFDHIRLYRKIAFDLAARGW